MTTKHNQTTWTKILTKRKEQNEINTLRKLLRRLNRQAKAYSVNMSKPSKTACKYLHNRKNIIISINKNTIHIQPNRYL